MTRKLTREALEHRTIDELRGYARREGIAGFSRMDKAELVEQLLNRGVEESVAKAGTAIEEYQYHGALWERILAYVAAFIALGLVVFVVVRERPLADARIAALLKTVLSLAIAVFGATIPGFLNVAWRGGGAVIRAGGALALFVVTYFYSPSVLPSLESSGVTRFRFEDQATAEPVYARLKLQFLRNGIPDEVEAVGRECVILGNSSEISPVGVVSAGFEYVQPQQKLALGVIQLKRRDPRSFLAAIEPMSPESDHTFELPAREEYYTATRLDKPRSQGELNVRNNTDYHIDIVLMPWKPKGIPSQEFSRRALKLPTCGPHVSKSYSVPEKNSTVYFIVYSSIFGQTAQYIAQGNLHAPEVLTVEIELQNLVTGQLAARQSRDLDLAPANGNLP